ncbi:hypothetical protein CPB86DRAFT_789653 [Serendipita vermifera]|nr:hypothetical protein CPB86DRAFT_789653 [Serendipita vermifera]
MTRITDLGRKRTYREAQFNNIFDDGEKVEDSAGTQDSFDNQPRKRRRKEQDGFPRDGTEQGVSQTTGWGRSDAVKANAIASEKRRIKRIQQRTDEMTCFACRQKGHSAQNCHKTKNSQSRNKPMTGICYRCGSSKHTLSRCPKPADEANPLPFASCFVCNGKGHLASTCPKNERGIYPNGGSCKLCSQTSHLAKDCPLRSKAPPAEGLLYNSNAGMDSPGADEDDFMVFKRNANQIAKDEQRHAKVDGRKPSRGNTQPAKKVVVF